MELDMTFNGVCFGKLKLPEVKTSIWGAKVLIQAQPVKILEVATFKAFVRSVIVNDSTRFQLENGECTIRSLGITAHCSYCLEIPIVGMMGPKATLLNLQRNGKNDERLTVTADLQNPGPVEIDHGWSLFELRNDKGESVADLEGDLKFVRGNFSIVLDGTVKKGVAVGETLRLAAVGVESSTWCNETIQFIDTTLQLTPEQVTLLQT